MKNQSLNKDIYTRIKQEAKTHSVDYIRIHHELEGLSLSNKDIQDISASKDYAEYLKGCTEEVIYEQTKAV